MLRVAPDTNILGPQNRWRANPISRPFPGSLRKLSMDKKRKSIFFTDEDNTIKKPRAKVGLFNFSYLRATDLRPEKSSPP